MFNHVLNKFNFSQLQEVNFEGKRHYKIEGELYPSITTILSAQKNEGLMRWRQSIGIDVANFETRRAATRGKIFHKIVEDYLNNKKTQDYKSNILPYGLFNLVKKEIDRVDNIHNLEVTLYSKKYKIAGRADCVAEFDGLLSVIDFKSANRAKKEDQLTTHAIQETAYSIMWEEMTKTPIKQIVTIVTCENGESQIIIEKPQFFIDKLESCIEDFWKLQNSKIIIK
ncbi:MAG: PD-(D/E)XK nuclease family protein [Crenarchaeota archaeon]|nr:PD-(D/E)XK nuclease family protein [Thermoproteota archaeon]